MILALMVGDAVTDRRVQLGQREEAPVAQLRQHEALDDLDRDLDLGLVARLDRTRVGSTTQP